MPSRFRRVLIIPSLCLFLISCGGGGGGGGGTPSPGDPGGPGTPPGQPGPGLAGALYFSAPSDNVRLDLASGTVTALRARDGGASASADASEFVAIEDAASGNASANDIVIYGANGADIVRFEVEGDLEGTPRLSRDGLYIAVHWWPSFSSQFDPGLAIFDRTGQLRRHYGESTELGAPDIESWDWEPTGTLLFTLGDGIYRTSPLVDPRLQPVASFPAGEPRALAVSADGSKIAFTLGNPGALEDHVFVMNADGTGQRQLTTSALNETSPAWSPDGSLVAVRQGVVGGFPVPPSSGCPTVFIVPASATNLTLDEANPAPAYLPQMIEGGQTRNVCAFSDLDWRPQ